MEINKDTSYLIGLFQSDGHMSKGKGNKGRAQLEISSKDEDIIHKIKEIIPYNYGIRKRTRKIIMKEKNYIHESISITICNMEFRKFLEINGVPYGKKSKIIDVPETKDILKIDYIRGLFDGDGSLGFTKNGFPYIGFVTESEKIKDYFLEFFSEITNNPKKENNRNTRDNLYNIVMFKEDAVKFCEIIYYDNCLSLNRKFTIAKNIIQWIRPLEMKKIDFERRKWTKEEDDFILNYSLEESIDKLNRTKKSIDMRKIRLKNNFLY
jgi:hypothetical protein